MNMHPNRTALLLPLALLIGAGLTACESPRAKPAPMEDRATGRPPAPSTAQRSMAPVNGPTPPRGRQAQVQVQPLEAPARFEPTAAPTAIQPQSQPKPLAQPTFTPIPPPGTPAQPATPVKAPVVPAPTVPTPTVKAPTLPTPALPTPSVQPPPVPAPAVQAPKVPAVPDIKAPVPALPATAAVPAASVKAPSVPAPKVPATPAAQPGAVQALLTEASAQEAAGNVDGAAATVERALRIEPRNPDLYHRLATLSLKQQEYAKTETMATKSIDLSGNDAVMKRANWYLIARARRAAGNPQGALQAEDAAAKLQ